MQNRASTPSHLRRTRPPSRRLLVLVLGAALVLTAGGWAFVGLRSSMPSTASKASEPCASRPDASSTGAGRVVRSHRVATLSTAGATLERASVSGPLKISGVGVTLRNVEVPGVVTVEADDVVLDHVTAQGVVISGVTGVTVRDSNFSGGGAAIVVRGAGKATPSKGIVLSGNFVHDPAPVDTALSVGTRVMGTATVSIRCSTYDLDGRGESVLAFDSADNGAPKVTVENTWLGGGTGYTVVTEARHLTMKNNVFQSASGDRWCRNNGTEHLVQKDNWTSDGSPVQPCGAPSPSSFHTESPSPSHTEHPSPSPSNTQKPTTQPLTLPQGTNGPSLSASPTQSSDTPLSGDRSSPTAVSDPTPQPSDSSTDPAPIPGCAMKPSASNTGATGSRKESSTTVLKSGQSLSNVNVAELEVRGDNVRLRNVQVNGYLLVLGDNVKISHVTARGIGISSASSVLVEYSDIGYTEGDGIHVTSDRGSTARDVTLRYNYVHDPRVSDTAHYDGTQVRGVNGLNISCSVYDPGPYRPQFNAAIYLEWANGGDANVVVERNWLYGFGFSVMVDARSTTVRNNRIGGDLHWRPCYLGDNSGAGGFSSSGNVWDSSGAPVNLCGQG